MTKRKIKHTTKSSSSGPMDLSTMQKDVLDLGRALVNELGLEPSVDTLGRWMAHYIAELIKEAENADIEDRPAKFARCSDAILKLWQHRRDLPDGKRPFEDMEPIMRAIESLDPDADTPRYFRQQRMAIAEPEQNSETQKWLELAAKLDQSAKILISYCLCEAAQTVSDKSKEWLALAEAVKVEDDIDLSVIRFISAESDLMNSDESEKKESKLIENRIQRLDGFKKQADALASDLRKQLERREKRQ